MNLQIRFIFNLSFLNYLRLSSFIDTLDYDIYFLEINVSTAYSSGLLCGVIICK